MPAGRRCATVRVRLSRRGRHAARKASYRPGGRILAIAVFAGIAVLLIVFQHLFRDLEAAAAARLYSVVRPTLAAPGAPIIWFGLGNPGAFGLIITPDCSSALLIVPLCAGYRPGDPPQARAAPGLRRPGGCRCVAGDREPGDPARQVHDRGLNFR
jgi:hypothetical protein